ncbi:MAG TPA: sulfotransferase [Acidimicrobiia bacterium]
MGYRKRSSGPPDFVRGWRYRSADALKALTPIAARRWLVRKRLQTRQLTSGRRLLPDFLIIGAQRGGTSSLYKYLGRHPDVAPSLRKEVGYFTSNYRMGETWYRSHFPLALRGVVHGRFRGVRLHSFEATPDYLFDPRVPHRAADLLPYAKLVVLLRNPVDRAFSHYLHMRRLGFEDLSFEAALDAEPERIGPDLESILVNPDHPSKAWGRYSYVERGKYADHLRAWLTHYPHKQLLVVRSEDLFTDTSGTMAEIVHHLQLARWSPPFFENHSYTTTQPDRITMQPKTRAHLRSVFAPHNQDLSVLLGRDMGWD